MNTIYFRVDGNEIIATGHVMRCLSVAKQVQALGGMVRFVLADGRPQELIEEQGFSCDILNSVWDDLNQETKDMISYIKREQVKVLFVDSYYVTEGYLQQIARYTKIVYMDDLQQFVYPVHTIVNYGLWIGNDYELEEYKRKNLEPVFLLGTRYVPLREEFRGVKARICPQVQKVLITTGGTDRLHVTLRLLEAVLNDSELCRLEYHVIVGCFNEDKNELYKIASENTNICIHEKAKNMSEWMRQCDIAVSAAGTTLYELAACGTPTICLEVADNQHGAVRWQENGYMAYAGNAAYDINTCIENSLNILIQYKKDYNIRCEYSKKMQSLVDGMGAERIAMYLLLLLTS